MRFTYHARQARGTGAPDGGVALVQPLRAPRVMRVSSSLRLVVCTWIAALVGALAGRALAEASSATASGARAAGAPHAAVAADRLGPR